MLRSRYPLAILAGLLLAASFPRMNIAGLAWVAPGLLVAAALGKRGAESFRIGYVGGLAHYLASLYWLLLIPYRWHSLPLGPALGWLLLAAFMALYPGLWVWIMSESARRQLSDSSTDTLSVQTEGPGSWLTAFARSLPSTWSGRAIWALSGAALWVAQEMIIARLFGGFPWNLLGASQYRMTPIIQLASITGVYGVSFLAVWFSLALFSAALAVIRDPIRRGAWIAEIILPMLAVAITFNLGYSHLKHVDPPARFLKVTLVQPNIPQTVIWDESRDDERIREVLSLSERALAHPTDLLVWPEAAVPKLLRWDRDTFDAVTNLAGSHHVWMIVGADDMTLHTNSNQTIERRFYNSSFLISPEGDLAEGYRKRALVIFGEYIPLVRWLPFLKWFTPIEGGFTPGTRSIPFPLANLGVKTSVLICYEDIFPHLGREYAADDVDVLVNITNNGWFGEAAAQWQHAACAVFRAVENGLPLIRCCNNGLTCWVDAQGRIGAIFQDEGSVYHAGFMTAQIPLPVSGQLHARTIYNQYGDWFGWLCVIAGALMVSREIVRLKWRKQKSTVP